MLDTARYESIVHKDEFMCIEQANDLSMKLYCKYEIG